MLLFFVGNSACFGKYIVCIFTWGRRPSSTRDRCVNYRLGQAICRRNGPPAGWRTCAGKARYDRCLPNTSQQDMRWRASFKPSDRARVSVSRLLGLVGLLKYLSMRLSNEILLCMILGECYQAATPRCHLPHCEPSKSEHVGEPVGSR